MCDSAAKKQPGRGGPGRPFEKGVSGNPKGKPRGVRSKLTMMAEQLLQDDAADVVAAVLTAARSGDMTAARLVLDRVLPVRKGRAAPIDMPKICDAAGVVAAMASVMAAMAEGTLSPEEASDAAAVIELQRRAIETVEIERRISALEATK